MRTVAPRVGFPEIMLAENQPEYLTTCAAVITYDDGSVGVMTRWRLTDEERQRIAAGEDLYLTLLTFGRPMQPIMLEVGHPKWAPEEDDG
ncbi:MAG: hypothetical protein QME96_05825 [Myxococcota bacterium]|nr:hypothetical protein [Myxococcota bacterium]